MEVEPRRRRHLRELSRPPSLGLGGRLLANFPLAFLLASRPLSNFIPNLLSCEPAPLRACGRLSCRSEICCSSRQCSHRGCLGEISSFGRLEHLPPLFYQLAAALCHSWRDMHEASHRPSARGLEVACSLDWAIHACSLTANSSAAR